MSELYNKEYKFLTWQNELEVVFSMMLDAQLMQLKDGIEGLINGRAYEEEGFPLSCGGLRFVVATIMFAFWVRKGKGVKVDSGEIVVCELKDSPFWHRYQSPQQMEVEEEREVYDENDPDHERNKVKREEEEGEFV